MRRLAAALAVALVVAACGGGVDERDSESQASAPSSTTSTTVLAPPSCDTPPQRAEPDPNRPRYTLRADVRPAERLVEGDVSVAFTPDLATDRLVFRLWPNSPRLADDGARLSVGEVEIDGQRVDTRLDDPTTLVAGAVRIYPAGRRVTVRVPWRLDLPGPVPDRVAQVGDTVRLGSFFPLLAWEPGVGWATEPPTGINAEAVTSPAADFDLRVTAPDGMQVLTGPSTNARDVAVAVGRFRTVTATANAPDPVTVTVAAAEGVADDPQAYLDKAVRVLEDFGRRFGPYPWPTYTIALTPEFTGGIEYPGFIHQGPGSIGRTTSHEAGHQWFYALVGNNQGRDPWLDEGVASYAEGRFEANLDDLQGRPVPPEGRGRTGEPMTYWESRRSAYVPSVYAQGAAAVAALGPDLERVDCALRQYVAANSWRIARPGDFFAAVSRVYPDAASAVAPYGLRP